MSALPMPSSDATPQPFAADAPATFELASIPLPPQKIRFAALQAPLPRVRPASAVPDTIIAPEPAPEALPAPRAAAPIHEPSPDYVRASAPARHVSRHPAKSKAKSGIKPAAKPAKPAKPVGQASAESTETMDSLVKVLKKIAPDNTPKLDLQNRTALQPQ